MSEDTIQRGRTVLSELRSKTNVIQVHVVMSHLLTPKQEKFCQQFISTGNASEAYRQSYDCSRMKNATINRAAHDLVENSKVTARIGELQEEGRKRHDIPFVVDHGATTITGLQGSINLHIGIVVTHA